MNGFMLLVLVVMAGQLGPGGLTMPPSSNPVQPASMLADPAPNADYGWQLGPQDGLLEYIVQISPDRAKVLEQNAKEQASTIPPIVASRIHRVVVRVGTLPIQSLSFEEVERLPKVERSEIADNLPAGRIKNLENSGPYDLQNVGRNGQPPPLTTGGLGANIADAPILQNEKLAEALGNPDNALAQAGRSGNPASNFIQDAMGRTGAATPGFPNAPTSPYGATGNNAGMPQSTAPPATLGSTATGLNPTGNNSVGIPGMGTAGLGANAATNNTSLNGGYNQPHSTAGNYTSLPSQTNTTLSGQPTRGGFAAPPAGSTQFGTNAPWPGSANNGYNSPGYGSQGYNTAQNNSTQNPNAPGYSAIPGANNQGYSNNSGYANNPSYANNSGYSQSPSNQSGYGNSPNGSYFHSDPPSVLVAQNTTALPGTSSSNSRTTNVSNRSGWDTSRDGVTDPNGLALKPTGVENIMPVMFVLSLVVNFYLGMLIRKLLGRYRTLLASVRSQTV